MTREALYPWNSVATDTVILSAVVEEDGTVSSINVLKSTASLDKPSIDAAKQWKFLPARMAGKVIRSVAYICFFNGRNFVSTSTKILFSENRSAGPALQLSLPTPIVCLEVDIEDDGTISASKVIRSIPSLEGASLKAANEWKFEPARLDRRAVRSKASISFVYDYFIATQQYSGSASVSGAACPLHSHCPNH
ncbi:MAG: hypothetical protein DMG76_27215 [Acidobacteria bacterium]|nr:MAG: hypothetical protein DMG76_27215 [Acidobacteriota bacterium]